jgi:hypothetical protein
VSVTAIDGQCLQMATLYPSCILRNLAPYLPAELQNNLLFGSAGSATLFTIDFNRFLQGVPIVYSALIGKKNILVVTC